MIPLEMEITDTEEHVCQSCGQPLTGEDYAGGSEKGDYCSFCIVHSSKEEVVAKLADSIQQETGKSREECLQLAEKQIVDLKRWQ